MLLNPDFWVGCGGRHIQSLKLWTRPGKSRAKAQWSCEGSRSHQLPPHLPSFPHLKIILKIFVSHSFAPPQLSPWLIQNPPTFRFVLLLLPQHCFLHILLLLPPPFLLQPPPDRLQPLPPASLPISWHQLLKPSPDRQTLLTILLWSAALIQ